jgi:tetratricopeptide (TPR) repeat protein
MQLSQDLNKSNSQPSKGSMAFSEADSLFEIGKLNYDLGNFFTAIEKFEVVVTTFKYEKKFDAYLKTINLLLRAYAETENYDQINRLKEDLQDLTLKEGIEPNSRTYYTLALSSVYKDQLDTAMEYVKKSLQLGLSSDNKEDICYAISCKAIILYRINKYDEALKEIYNLQIFFQVLDFPEVRISSLVLNGRILIDLEKYDQAIEVLWQAYELVKYNKTLAMHFHVLYNLGRAYAKLGDKNLARIYLSLASKSIDPKNMRKLASAITEELLAIGENEKECDLFFNLEDHAVVEKKMGKVDFKNQFILLDLLKLFALNQGKVFSKEYLVEKIWKQTYDPAVHDNKIYVTIKRLRKLIEPDYDKPKYIYRAKNGYFMNKAAKIIVAEPEGGIQ